MIFPHCIYHDRVNRFFPATNMLRRHAAITRGNVFAKNCAENLTVGELKEALESGNERVIRKLAHFGAPVGDSIDIKMCPKNRSRMQNLIRLLCLHYSIQKMFAAIIAR